MAGDALSYWDYLKAAFGHKPKLGWLGRMPVNQMGIVAFVIAGLANPGFWLVGLAAEVAYLFFRSSSLRFQKLVEAELLQRRRIGFEERVRQAAASLSETSRERYRRLLRECGQLLGLAQGIESERVGTLSDFRAGGLNQLLWLFLRLLTSREVIVANLSQVDQKDVEAEVDRVRERLLKAPPDSALARSLKATLEIQIKRLDNLAKARTSLDVIDAELERIEQQVHLLREESAVSGGPEAVSARLDTVSQTLAETSRWMDQNAELLGSLGVDDLDTGPARLPTLPEEPPRAAPPPPPPPRPRQKA